MKKLLLLVIILTTLTNISYASFPVIENIQDKNIQIIDDNQNTGGLLFTVLSVLLSLLSLLFIFLFIGSGFSHNGNPFLYLFLSIGSVVATIFSGIEAKRRGQKTSKSFIGISIIVISLLLIRYLLFV